MKDYMKIILSFIYLVILANFLLIITFLVLKQSLKTTKEESLINKLEKNLPENLNVHEKRYILGDIYINKRMYPQTIELLEKSALQSTEIPEPLKASLYNSLGFAYLKSQNYIQAIANYKQVLSVKPTYKLALNNLAYLYEKLGKLPQALHTYQLILNNNGDHSLAKQKVKMLNQKIK
uniref:Tetratricopeptide repeat protein n=1 Tax=Sciadococcus taiwanensis TaxID=3028030 RepID=A0A9Y1I273_9RHOD|nr:hypothetical protein SCTW_144 [Sciadococcus taiwanensis]